MNASTPVDAHGDRNQCVICLESLVLQAVGASVPCGHCFHVDCWNSWQQQQASRSHYHHGYPTKCPLCNTPTSTFTRLFIDLNTDKSQDDDIDAGSISSIESEGGVDEETSRAPARPSFQETVRLVEPCRSAETDESSIVEVIQFQPSRQGGTTSLAKPCSHSTSSTQKYKRMAKALKKRLEGAVDRVERLTSEKNRLDRHCSELEARCKKNDTAIDDFEEHVGKLEEKIRQTSLDVVRLRDERNNLKREFQKTMESYTMTKAALDQLERRYAHEIEKARSHSMTEVQSILKQHPILTNEVHKLKELISRKDQIIEELNGKLRAAKEKFHPHSATITSSARPTITGTTHQKRPSSRSRMLGVETVAPPKPPTACRVDDAAKAQTEATRIKLKRKASAHAVRVAASSHNTRPSFNVMEFLEPPRGALAAHATNHGELRPKMSSEYVVNPPRTTDLSLTSHNLKQSMKRTRPF